MIIDIMPIGTYLKFELILEFAFSSLEGKNLPHDQLDETHGDQIKNFEEINLKGENGA
jgi:hypothetical protein